MNILLSAAQAADENTFLGNIQPPLEQSVGHGRSALWTLPNVATQYQPLHPTPAMQSALQAQAEGRFLDALIALDDARKSGQLDTDAKAEIDLLRASFLLQGNQTQQVMEILAPLLSGAQYAANAYALTAMAHLQQGQMQQALDAAQRGYDLHDGMLPYLALSYALQGMGRLPEARDVMHRFNEHAPQQAVALAREAELALTLGQVQPAMQLVHRAQGADGTHSYVLSVSGLAWLLDGNAKQAKAAFETALQRDPKDAKALLGLGLAEIKLGHFQEGRKKLQDANEAAPGDALILTYLGRAQQQLGETGAARASWRSAQQADPKDPTPWLYQAQAELQANRPLDARESLREAQARMANRSVYRGEHLLMEDRQVLQSNLAEVQRQLGMENLAFHTLSDSVGEKNAASLRNQADLLQGQRFGESARRSLLLQSLFNDRPGNLPAALDIYGDGAGQTGAMVPQHGAVSGLGALQASYNNYDALFNRSTALEADVTAGNRNTSGGQIRLGTGSDTLGLTVAGLKFKTDGFAPFENLDNRVAQGVMQWRPNQSAQAFASYQTFNSKRGEITCPADPLNCGVFHQYEDGSSVTRAGLRYNLSDYSELRGLLSRQQTSQTDNWQWMSDFLPPPNNTIPQQGVSYGIDHNSSAAKSGEVQYRRSGTDYAMQLGLSTVRSPTHRANLGTSIHTNVAQQIYMEWQQALNPDWQMQAGLAWGRNDKLLSVGNTNVSTYLRRWLPKMGLVYTPDSATHMRLATWKGLDDAAVGNASLASASLAGIVLHRPGDTYQLVRGVALGADRQLNPAWQLEGQAQRRWTDSPYFLLVQRMKPTQIDESRLALHWQPGVLNVTLAYDDEFIQNDPAFQSPDSVLKQHLRSQQLDLRWLAGAQWAVNLAWSHNLVTATQQSSDIAFNPILLDVRQHFNQTDTTVNWKFNRAGSMDVGVRNAADNSLQYTEIDPLAPRFSKGRLVYAKLRLAW